MSQKIYRTVKGKTVDIGALRLQNEHVRAVGNMGVNARGDRIDAQGNVIDPIGKQVQRRIQRQTNVSDTPVHTSQRAADSVVPTMPTPLDDDTFLPLDDSILGDVDQVAAPVVSAPMVGQEEPVGGLAAAIARAKLAKDSNTGVTKI
jgi:hypothetical protein